MFLCSIRPTIKDKIYDLSFFVAIFVVIENIPFLSYEKVREVPNVHLTKYWAKLYVEVSRGDFKLVRQLIFTCTSNCRIKYKILLAHIRAHGSWYIGKIEKKSTWYASSWNLYTAISETYTYIYTYILMLYMSLAIYLCILSLL